MILAGAVTGNPSTADALAPSAIRTRQRCPCLCVAVYSVSSGVTSIKRVARVPEHVANVHQPPSGPGFACMCVASYLTVFKSADWALTSKIVDMADIVNFDKRKDDAVWTRPPDPDLILGVDGCCFKDEHMFARCSSSSLACKSGVTPGAGWFLPMGESREIAGELG